MDTDDSPYPPEVLFKIKTEHEKRVVRALQQGSIDYTFAELEVIAAFLIRESGKAAGSPNYQLFRLSEKIKKNQLTDVQGYIDMGLLLVSRISVLYTNYCGFHYGYCKGIYRADLNLFALPAFHQVYQGMRSRKSDIRW